MVKLDYNAGVPISDGVQSDAKYIALPPGVIAASTKESPGDRFRDYIPRIEEAPRKPQRSKDTMQQPRAKYDRDFVPADEALVRRKDQQSRITQIAKEIYKKSRIKAQEYNEAQAVVDASSPQDRMNPDAKLGRAMRIASRTKPLSKEEALERATEQFFGSQE